MATDIVNDPEPFGSQKTLFGANEGQGRENSPLLLIHSAGARP